MSTRKPVKIIDTTLRDGSHAVHHQFSAEDITRICKGLEAGGVYAAEVSHGAGIGGSTLQFGRARLSDRDMLTTAAAALKNTKLAVLLVPGLGTMEDLKVAKECGVEIVRIAVHCTEIDVAIQHVKLAKEIGLEVCAFFMMTHMISADELLGYMKEAESYGVDYIYMADSAGAMVPEDIAVRVKLLKKELNVPIGLHCHNNLGLAIGNSVVGYEAGLDFIDATLQGLGPGSGNTPTEPLVAVLNKMKVDSGCNLYALMDTGDKYVKPLIQHTIQVTNQSLILGYAGIYSSFYQKALDIAEEYDLDPRDIFVRLGDLKVIGGQEDMILDIAYKMAQERKAAS
ncbi:4-hydroxy-2-oxovalerate aldolase [Marinobacterium rhizophilum]|uniref:4-hydroxy-2-oxovalerate aldolase n=1 Tax=Marinobacterium rhizophilum TaxID=420402 RepID=A0ABY5HI22_9GAMM|nr:4-hydroxy-2-oxovalerate aldolase [Marinobacterium rhizophilum]UTW12015.1 4-hydroxy-2-oxovalerate aldolase [Marinobacterium rhizophilum]